MVSTNNKTINTLTDDNNPLWLKSFTNGVGIKYKCDDENNPPSVLEENRINSQIILTMSGQSGWDFIDLSDYLTWILNNTEWNRNQVLEYGKKVCYPLIKKAIRKKDTKFIQEWNLYLTRLCYQAIPNELIKMQLKNKFLE